MDYEYTVHKYRDLSRWEFRFWDEMDGEMDARHIVVFDTYRAENFCVIMFREIDNETANTRVREYAEIDANSLLSDDEMQRRILQRFPTDDDETRRKSNAEFRRIWVDAITDGIMRGLTRTRRHYE